MIRKKGICIVVLASLTVFFLSLNSFSADKVTNPLEGEQQEKLEQREKEEKEVKREPEIDIEAKDIELPRDESTVFEVKEVSLKGNSWVSTETIFKNIPDIYNSSDVSIKKAPKDALYDFRNLKELVENPGITKKITGRTVQGLTDYILRVYQRQRLAGIYVYVPADSFQDGKPKNQKLVISIIEASVSDVEAEFYNPDRELKEKSYLKRSYLLDWSPVDKKKGLNKKKLDDYLNILNLNPDRYTTAIVTTGMEPNSISVNYNVYEADPVHWYIQTDNSGRDDREWNPRVGFIHTNLFGIDDTFSVLFQAPWDSKIFDEYSVFASYSLPIYGPRVRLELSAGYNEYDVTGGGALNFLGRGHTETAKLRFNLFQIDEWLYDFTTSVIHEESRVSPTDFPGTGFLTSDLEIDMWGTSFEVYKRNYLSDILFSFSQVSSFDGSDAAEFTNARTLAQRDFTIYTTSAIINQYLDENQINKFSGSFRWITSEERLVPSRLTTFGGMYTVRGYEEYEIVTDGGILTSLQYEYDLAAKEQSLKEDPEEDPFISKLAPLVFFDYGLAETEDPVTGIGETEDRELASVGAGLKLELSNSLTGTVFYGYPLIETEDTDEGTGRVHAGFLLRW